MKIYVLIENTASGNLICEHGLSLLIENKDKKILLDAGSTDKFLENADCMGIDLSDIDFAVLSHGHYDHSGGFDALFEINHNVKVYAKKEAACTYYSGNGGMHEIGVPREVLAHNDRFIFTDKNAEIDNGIYLIGHNTENLSAIGQKAKLYKEENTCIVPDDFIHEQSLVFDTQKGLVIFNSCSHAGAANIIREVREYCDNKQIYAYIGGLHMKGKADGKEICAFSDDEIDLLCDAVKEEKISMIYTGHCTGLPGLEKMKERLGDTVQALTTGLVFEV